MKNNSKVLVALVAENYLEYAKQMFSSAYFNGGWDGDFMILAYDNIPDKKLQWFYDKGFSVKRPKPLLQYDIARLGWSHFFLTKFYLFQEDMKKWDTVVYVDVDCIVRSSLLPMTKVKTIAGVPFFHVDDSVFFQGQELKAKNLFMGGTFSFSTSIITPNTFNDLLKITKDLYEEVPLGVHNMGNEEIVYKRYFGNKVERLPMIFNSIPLLIQEVFGVKEQDVKGAILHLASDLSQHKPWHVDSVFHEEWLANLAKANQIDLKNPVKPVDTWSWFEALKYEVWLRWPRKSILALDKSIGRVGIYIKKVSPRVYFLLKKVLFKNRVK